MVPYVLYMLSGIRDISIIISIIIIIIIILVLRQQLSGAWVRLNVLPFLLLCFLPLSACLSDSSYS